MFFTVIPLLAVEVQAARRNVLRAHNGGHDLHRHLLPFLPAHPVAHQGLVQGAHGQDALLLRGRPPPRLLLPGMNCIKKVLPGKSILGDFLQENITSRRPFLLLRIDFSGRPIFIQLPPGHGRVPRLGHLFAQRRLPQRRAVLLLHVRHSLRQHELPPHRRAGRLSKSHQSTISILLYLRFLTYLQGDSSALRPGLG